MARPAFVVSLSLEHRKSNVWEVNDTRVLYEGNDAVEAERVWRAALNDTVGAQGSQG